jgi:hypothetical protein
MKITKLILRSVTQYLGHSTSVDGAKHTIEFDPVRQIFLVDLRVGIPASYVAEFVYEEEPGKKEKQQSTKKKVKEIKDEN